MDENGPFEDVVPSKNGEKIQPASYVSFTGG